jgi:predicted enzyme related to lactoylglutathione lyase
VATPPLSSAKVSVEAAWQVLNTNDAARAIVNYRELFGWEIQERVEIPGQGVFHPFAWRAGDKSSGVIADITGMPGRHPHWLFFFEVEALEPAMNATRAAGGLVLDPIVLPSGERICACDDPQGAAFGLIERRPSA